MFNFRPDERWPWLRIEPPIEDVPGFRVAPPEAEDAPGFHLWSPPMSDPPAFRIATDGAVRDDVAFAGPGSAVGLSPPPRIGFAVEDRLPKDNPFNFLDRHRLTSPHGGMPPSPQLSPMHSWMMEPPSLEPEMQGYLDTVDAKRDTPHGPTYLVTPPRNPLQQAFDQLSRIYAGVGLDLLTPLDGRGPHTSPTVLRGEKESPAVDDTFDPQYITPVQSGGGPTASFPDGLAEPSARAAPMVSGIFPRALGEQNPSATLVGDPPKSPLLPVGGDGRRYIQNRMPDSVGGARGIGVEEEGREVLRPEKPDNRELDPFEKLKQRGYQKPAEDPGHGSTIVTDLRKHYLPNHPNYHRYEFRDALCDLGTAGCSVEAAYDALLRYAIPGGPAPGVTIENGKVSPVSFKGIPGGHVQTFVEPESRSIINQTMPNHNFHDGFAQRQIVVENGKVYIRTFGEGANTTGDRAIANRIMAKAAFEDTTAAIRAALNPPQPPKAGQKWPR